MKLETVLLNLMDAVGDERTSPDRLATLYYLALTKLVEASPVGKRAMQLVENKIIMERMADLELRISQAKMLVEREERNKQIDRKPRNSGKRATRPDYDEDVAIK